MKISKLSLYENILRYGSQSVPVLHLIPANIIVNIPINVAIIFLYTIGVFNKSHVATKEANKKNK